MRSSRRGPVALPSLGEEVRWLCAGLSRPLRARSYNGGMTSDDVAHDLPEEVITMAKRDEGTRDIKKGKESER